MIKKEKALCKTGGKECVNMLAFYWFMIAVILVVIEIATLGVTTIWFAIGAAIAGFLNLAGLPLSVQVGAFVIVSLILLLLTRPLAVKYLNSRVHKTNADSLVGETCLTTEAIDNIKGQGQVTVRGLEWTARSKDGRPIAKDTRVKILAIQGVKLIVEPEAE